MNAIVKYRNKRRIEPLKISLKKEVTHFILNLDVNRDAISNLR